MLSKMDKTCLCWHAWGSSGQGGEAPRWVYLINLEQLWRRFLLCTDMVFAKISPRNLVFNDSVIKLWKYNININSSFGNPVFKMLLNQQKKKSAGIYFVTRFYQVQHSIVGARKTTAHGCMTSMTQHYPAIRKYAKHTTNKIAQALFLPGIFESRPHNQFQSQNLGWAKSCTYGTPTRYVHAKRPETHRSTVTAYIRYLHEVITKASIKIFARLWYAPCYMHPLPCCTRQRLAPLHQSSSRQERLASVPTRRH